MHIDLKNRNALVCGNTQGIGKAAAFALAESGANVTLAARSEASLSQVRDELPTGLGQQHQFMVADFQDPTGLVEKAELALSSIGVFHILVNNTGGPPAGLAIEARAFEFVNAFQAHLICNQYLVQAFVPSMKKAKY